MKSSLTLQCTWHPEYCSYMIEVSAPSLCLGWAHAVDNASPVPSFWQSTPSGAYGGYADDLRRVEVCAVLASSPSPLWYSGLPSSEPHMFAPFRATCGCEGQG